MLVDAVSRCKSCVHIARMHPRARGNIAASCDYRECLVLFPLRVNENVAAESRFRIEHRRQVLELDVDRLNREFSDFETGRGDRGNRMAGKQHTIKREY